MGWSSLSVWAFGGTMRGVVFSGYAGVEGGASFFSGDS